MRLLRHVILIGLLVLVPAGLLRADGRAFASRHYQIHTDLAPGVAEDMARRLDQMYEEYSVRLVRFDAAKESPKPASVYLFGNKEQYIRFIGNNMRSSAGAFIPGRNALAALADGQGRDALRRTLQHEAFHQFASTTFGPRMPVWLNEGLAQYFEEGLWTADGFVSGQVPPRRLRQLNADIEAKRIIPFDKMLTMAPEVWEKALAARSPTRGATQYNQAWAMVHFLVQVSDENGTPRLRQRFLDWLKQIELGADPQASFVTAFSANYAGYQQRFLEWSRTLKPTPEAEYLERQEVLADFYAAVEKYGKVCNDMATLRQTTALLHVEMQYSTGQVKWSTGKNPDVYFSKLDGTLFGPGELYLQDGQKAPLPDIVCRCLPTTQIRTHFYKTGEKLEHESVLEPLGGGQRPMASQMTPTRAQPTRK